VTLLLFLYVTEEAGGIYVWDMPWPLTAECNMITNKQTVTDIELRFLPKTHVKLDHLVLNAKHSK
jgi:hypothetical protein